MKWLVDEHCCPLRSIRISNGKVHGAGGSYTPILTSKGRSLLGIALGNRNIGIVRYLVVDKRMLLSGEKGLDVETLTQNLDLVLRVLPEEALVQQALGPNDRISNGSGLGATAIAVGSSENDSVEISAIAVAAALDEEAADVTDNEVSCSCHLKHAKLFSCLDLGCPVYPLLRQSNQLCIHSLRASNLLSPMRKPYITMPCMCSRLRSDACLQTVIMDILILLYNYHWLRI